MKSTAKILIIQFVGRVLLYTSGMMFGVFLATGGDHLPRETVILVSFTVPVLSNVIFGVMASWGSITNA